VDADAERLRCFKCRFAAGELLDDRSLRRGEDFRTWSAALARYGEWARVKVHGSRHWMVVPFGVAVTCSTRQVVFRLPAGVLVTRFVMR
jgi:hypothetical protein